MSDDKRRWRGPEPGGERGDSGRGEAPRQRVRNAKTPSSRAWLDRQLNDPYVRQAKALGLRARAAFKLMQLDDRFALLRRGARVIDLGAAPGGWAQVAVQRGAGTVVGIDLLPVEPLPGAMFLLGDAEDPDMRSQLLARVGGRPDVVLSDMAANTTGHARTDQMRTGALAELAARFALETLAPGGVFVTKAFQGGLDTSLLGELKRAFRDVRHAKPAASRAESHEVFLIAKGFRGAPD